MPKVSSMSTGICQFYYILYILFYFLLQHCGEFALTEPRTFSTYYYFLDSLPIEDVSNV